MSSYSSIVINNHLAVKRNFLNFWFVISVIVNTLYSTTVLADESQEYKDLFASAVDTIQKVAPLKILTVEDSKIAAAMHVRAAVIFEKSAAIAEEPKSSHMRAGYAYHRAVEYVGKGQTLELLSTLQGVMEGNQDIQVFQEEVLNIVTGESLLEKGVLYEKALLQYTLGGIGDIAEILRELDEIRYIHFADFDREYGYYDPKSESQQ